MQKLMSILPIIGLCSCAHYSGDQSRIINTNGTETVTTKVKIGTLFDAKSELSKLNLSTTDKSQRQALGSLNQETTATNLVNIFEAVARGAAAGAGKVVAP